MTSPINSGGMTRMGPPMSDDPQGETVELKFTSSVGVGEKFSIDLVPQSDWEPPAGSMLIKIEATVDQLDPWFDYQVRIFNEERVLLPMAMYLNRGSTGLRWFASRRKRPIEMGPDEGPITVSFSRWLCGNGFTVGQEHGGAVVESVGPNGVITGLSGGQPSAFSEIEVTLTIELPVEEEVEPVPGEGWDDDPLDCHG